MKAGIHPKYHDNVKVTCACGNSFETGSTLPEIKVDICSACHPFFTGETNKYIDTAGRIDKFMDREKKKVHTTKRHVVTSAPVLEEVEPQTLKDMLHSAKKAIKNSTSH